LKGRAHLKHLVKVALGTGMRLGKQVNLCWQNVDFTRSVLIVTNTKSGKDREIPMNPDVLDILRSFRNGSTQRGFVFKSSRIETHVKEVKRSFKTALRLAGIEGLVWHDLRATFGTRLGEAGYDAFTIASLMGHSDIHTTARYVRATERNKREAVEAGMLGSQKVVHKLATKNWGEPLG
jgi:integrase